jgi:hypothetical protein
MTHEVAHAVLVIHEVAAEREAIPRGNAATNSIIGYNTTRTLVWSSFFAVSRKLLSDWYKPPAVFG